MRNGTTGVRAAHLDCNRIRLRFASIRSRGPPPLISASYPSLVAPLLHGVGHVAGDVAPPHAAVDGERLTRRQLEIDVSAVDLHARVLVDPDAAQGHVRPVGVEVERPMQLGDVAPTAVQVEADGPGQGRRLQPAPVQVDADCTGQILRLEVAAVEVQPDAPLEPADRGVGTVDVEVELQRPRSPYLIMDVRQGPLLPENPQPPATRRLAAIRADVHDPVAPAHVDRDRGDGRPRAQSSSTCGGGAIRARTSTCGRSHDAQRDAPAGGLERQPPSRPEGNRLFERALLRYPPRCSRKRGPGPPIQRSDASGVLPPCATLERHHAVRHATGLQQT